MPINAVFNEIPAMLADVPALKRIGILAWYFGFLYRHSCLFNAALRGSRAHARARQQQSYYEQSTTSQKQLLYRQHVNALRRLGKRKTTFYGYSRALWRTTEHFDKCPDCRYSIAIRQCFFNPGFRHFEFLKLVNSLHSSIPISISKSNSGAC
jgi:hypothetical protein